MDAADLASLQKKAQDCHACALSKTRTSVVFGTGSPAARVMLVGEGPGEHEDLRGEPFVGRAGILLDKMLRATGFSREKNVYIANMVKCRPPGNRDPAPEEVETCLFFLREQLRLIAPEYIVCLGRIAAQALIDPSFRVTAQHGQFIKKSGVMMMGTFHPAALLRDDNRKPEAFDDFCKLRDRVLAG